MPDIDKSTKHPVSASHSAPAGSIYRLSPVFGGAAASLLAARIMGNATKSAVIGLKYPIYCEFVYDRLLSVAAAMSCC